MNKYIYMILWLDIVINPWNREKHLFYSITLCFSILSTFLYLIQ